MMNDKYYKIEEYSNLVKDTNSNAILNHDRNQMLEHRKKKLFFDTLVKRQDELERIVIRLEEKIKILEGKLNG